MNETQLIIIGRWRRRIKNRVSSAAPPVVTDHSATLSEMFVVCLSVFPEPLVQSECRDRYFWIQVASGETPRFEAVGGYLTRDALGVSFSET